MADEERKPDSDDNASLEREIRRGRKFSLNDAIGQMAGQGMMKGGSPVSPVQQAEFEIEFYLREHLSDASGVLPLVVHRHVKLSDRLLRDATKPLSVLAAYLRQVLESPDLLRDLVREADVEWGRRLGERPHFEKDGQPPHPEDPYTLESVRTDLARLLETLSAGGHSAVL